MLNNLENSSEFQILHFGLQDSLPDLVQILEISKIQRIWGQTKIRDFSSSNATITSASFHLL